MLLDKALGAVKNNGHALRYASDKIKNMKDIVINAVKITSFASKRLKNEKTITLINFTFYDIIIK